MKELIRSILSKRWMGLGVILIGLAAVAFAVALPKPLPRVEGEEQAMTLPVITVQRTKVTPQIEGYGTARAARVWSAVTEVKGRVEAIHCLLEAGHRIAANEVLLKIEDSDYQLRLKQRMADLDSAQANLDEIIARKSADEASLKIAQKMQALSDSELKRAIGLKENNAVSQSNLDAARSNFLQQTKLVLDLENSLSLFPSKKKSSEAAIALAKSRVKEAERDLERTTIRSPFGGVLAGVKLEVDQIVGQNQKLFELHDDSKVEIEAHFSLAQIQKISSRLLAQSSDDVLLDSIAAYDKYLLSKVVADVTTQSGDVLHRWTGRAVRVSDSVNQRTRTVGIVIQVDNLEVIKSFASLDKEMLRSRETPLSAHEMPYTLRGGTFCEVTLSGKPLDDVIAIPRTAVNGNTVYVVETEDGASRLKARTIEVDFRMGDIIVVRSGLDAGDVIAVRYPVPAIDGKLVKPESVAATISSEMPQLTNQPEAGRQR